MARCHVTFEEVERPARIDDRIEVELGSPPPPPWRGRAGLEDRRPRPGRWIGGAVVVVLALWALWPTAAPPDDDEGVEDAASVRTPSTGSGTVVVRAADVVAEPWGGVFEHHPDLRGAVSVPQVHLLSVAGQPGTSALFVVDATRRAFGDPDRAWDAGADLLRQLGTGEGAGLRSLQWDDEGYGISLTAVGLTLAEHGRLAAALVLPEGRALVHGRAPTLDDEALRDLDLDVTYKQSAPGTSLGSPLIGQSGGASIDGLVHRSDGGTVLVSVVEDQLASASRVRRALAPVADVPEGAVPGATSAALLRHEGAPETDRRVRGWNRLLVDHPAGVTVELSSDVLSGDQLVALAGQLDVDRLARTVAPRR